MPARSGGSEIAGAHECIAWLILVLVATTNPKDQYCNRRHRIDFRNQLTQHVPRGGTAEKASSRVPILTPLTGTICSLSPQGRPNVVI